MALLAKQNISLTDLKAIMSAVTLSDTIKPNTGQLLVRNTDVAARTLTMVSRVVAVPGLGPANLMVVLDPGGTYLIGPLNNSNFIAPGVTPLITVTFDAIAGVTAAVVD